MFKFMYNERTMRLNLLTFGAGVYAGIYLSQNYDIPRVDEPSQLWQKIKDFADSHKKPDNK